MNIFRNSILGCAMILGIFSNDVNASTMHKVDRRVFQHNVSIYHNTNYQHRSKINLERSFYGLKEDTKTTFGKEVSKIFGGDYKLIENWRCDFIELLCKKDFDRYKNKLETLEIKDNTNKEGNKYIKKSFIPIFTGTFEELMKDNNFELVTHINDYKWEGTVTNNNGIENLNNKLRIGEIVITDGNNVIYYNIKKRVIKIYRNKNIENNNSLFRDYKKFIDKFKKLGLFLQKAFEIEEKAVKEISGENSILEYWS